MRAGFCLGLGRPLERAVEVDVRFLG